MRRWERVAFRAANAVLVLGLSVACRADSFITIDPTFDATITNDVNAASIESTINSAIHYYDTTFTTHFAPLTVEIQFHETPSGLGGSTTGLYKLGYGSVDTALHSASSGDATDTAALSGLPPSAVNPVTGTTNINLKSANCRALGFNCAPAVKGFDGEIGINTSLTSPPGSLGPSAYSLLSVVEHEIDEVLGLGSDVGGTGFFADPAMEDLFRYNSAGARSYTTAGDDAWFSLNGTTKLAQFNQSGVGDYGDWHLGGTTRVQDAFGTPGVNTTLANDGGAEVVALDAIGYNVASSSVPEPSAYVALASMLFALGVAARRRAGSPRGQRHQQSSFTPVEPATARRCAPF